MSWLRGFGEDVFPGLNLFSIFVSNRLQWFSVYVWFSSSRLHCVNNALTSTRFYICDCVQLMTLAKVCNRFLMCSVLSVSLSL